MKYTIDLSSSEPAYMQLYKALRQDIVHGVMPYGAKLPSKRVLSEDAGVSVITAEHAYAILADEGYIEPRQRSGYFVTYREKDTFSVADIVSKPIDKLEKIHPAQDEFPYSTYARTVRKVLSDYGEDILSVSPHAGVPELRSAICNYLGRSRGIYVDPTQVIVGAGSAFLYPMIIQILGRNRIYGLETPSFDRIRQIYRSHGIRLDFLKLGPEGVLTEELERTPASVLHVTPYNSYPTGITATASKRREYVQWAHEHEAYIVEDDFDSEFSSLTKREDTLFSLDNGEHVIYTNTFTKTISAGVRAGYLVLPKHLLSIYEKNAGFYTCPVPLLQQYVLAELLNSGDFERHINRIRRKRRAAQNTK